MRAHTHAHTHTPHRSQSDSLTHTRSFSCSRSQTTACVEGTTAVGAGTGIRAGSTGTVGMPYDAQWVSPWFVDVEGAEVKDVLSVAECQNILTSSLCNVQDNDQILGSQKCPKTCATTNDERVKRLMHAYVVPPLFHSTLLSILLSFF